MPNYRLENMEKVVNKTPYIIKKYAKGTKDYIALNKERDDLIKKGELDNEKATLYDCLVKLDDIIKDDNCYMYYYDTKRAEGLNNVILYNTQNSVSLGIESIIEKVDKLNNPGRDFKEEMRYIFNIWGHGGATKETCVEGKCKRRVSLTGFNALNYNFSVSDKKGINKFPMSDFVDVLFKIFIANLKKKKRQCFIYIFQHVRRVHC
jgi:hypothetical protein